MRDNADNKICVTSADSGIAWSDISVRTDSTGAKLNGQWVSNTWIVATNVGMIDDVAAGDSLVVSATSGDVEITLRYNPTNSLIGSWTINV